MIGIQTQISLFARSVGDTARAIARPTLLAPFAAIGALELLLLCFYLKFMAFGTAGEALVSFFFGAQAVHYPQHVWMIPTALAWVRVAAAAILGAAMYPRATRRLLAFHTAAPLPEFAAGGAGTTLAAVMGYALLEAAMMLGVGHLADVRVIGRLQPLWVAATLVMRPMLMIVLAHTVWGIAVSGRRGAAALRSGVVVARRRGVETLLLSFAAALLTAPLAVAVSLSGMFVEAGAPPLAELVAVLAVLVDIPVRRVIFGSTVWLRSPRGVLP